MNNESNLKQYLADHQQRLEVALEKRLPHGSLLPVKLHEAIRYMALDGGKRFRPVLVYAAGDALGIPADRLDGVACAVECIHVYSLVHDDLPAMDDDDLRRGRKTCHKAFDEATAILVGDALQSQAFHILASDASIDVNASQRLKMVAHLALAAGSRGMAGGQALDLDAEGKQLNLAELENLHIHKTGALIRACVRLATLAADEVDDAQVKALDHFAKCVGLAFQVQDDILDVAGDTETLGKTQGKDQVVEKATYPALMGLVESRKFARELLDDALNSIASFDERADPLRWLAEYVVKRNF